MIRHTRVAPLLAALFALALQGCSYEYSADPITATVVDAETKLPLEGVVVAAHWEMKGGLEGGNVEGEVMIMEAVTDSAGKFHFPAWGPKKVYVGLSNAQLIGDTPEMILFKSGYRIGLAANHVPAKVIHPTGPHFSSDWNGKRITMDKFKGTLQEYATHVGDFFPGYAFEGHCRWRSIPRMLHALGKQTRDFRAQNIHTGNFYDFLISNDAYQSAKGCGSAAEFLTEHDK